MHLDRLKPLDRVKLFLTRRLHILRINRRCFRSRQPFMIMKDIKAKIILRTLLVFAYFIIIPGCSTVRHYTDRDWTGYTESGKASFYADKHQNRRTASGDLYRHDLKTAAHKELPFGSNVKVTNVNNGKSVAVTINDRGPFEEGRIIDLSKSSFRSIGNTSSGLIDVKIEVIR